MKKKNKRPVEIEIVSYGQYEQWDKDKVALPNFQKLATELPAEIGMEFGMIVEIKRARGRYLDFVIDHPPFKDDTGIVMPPFTGTFRVKHNPFHFFLGDSIWEPIDDKRGEWRLSILLDDEELVAKSIMII